MFSIGVSNGASAYFVKTESSVSIGQENESVIQRRKVAGRKATRRTLKRDAGSQSLRKACTLFYLILGTYKNNMEKKIVETFRNPLIWLRDTVQNEPTAFNGEVRVKKYRITVEEISEPIEIIQERLQQLWDDCDNFHHWTPLKRAAEVIGYTLTGPAGKNVKRMTH
jgi:hypothetical protein